MLYFIFWGGLKFSVIEGNKQQKKLKIFLIKVLQISKLIVSLCRANKTIALLVMKKFHLVCLFSARISKRFDAKSYDDAVEMAQEKGWDLDDHFIEEAAATYAHREQMTERQWENMRLGYEAI